MSVQTYYVKEHIGGKTRKVVGQAKTYVENITVDLFESELDVNRE